MPTTTDRDALKALVTAWEALPTGHYSPREIERWLKDHMKPAIDAGRVALNIHKSNDDRT